VANVLRAATGRVNNWDSDLEPLACTSETIKALRKQAREQRKKTTTYNRRDSQMVTHFSTSRPVQCLCMAERTGCPVFTDLWSYVLTGNLLLYMIIWQTVCRETRSDMQLNHPMSIPSDTKL
jgi:hypothetical protein